jgi:hypothetical protein
MVYGRVAFDRLNYNFRICVSKFHMRNSYCSKYRDVNGVKYFRCYGVQLASSYCVLRSSVVYMSNKIQNILVEITNGQSGFDFWFGQEILCSMKTCRGPTCPLLNGHLDTFSPGLKRKRCKYDHSPLSSTEFKDAYRVISLLHIPSRCGAKFYRDNSLMSTGSTNFTFMYARTIKSGSVKCRKL